MAIYDQNNLSRLTRDRPVRGKNIASGRYEIKENLTNFLSAVRESAPTGGGPVLLIGAITHRLMLLLLLPSDPSTQRRPTIAHYFAV